MLYKDLNLKVKDQIETRDKNDLVQIALQNSRENGVINEIKLEIYFNIYIVYFYTDLVFSEEEKADPGQLYDELQSNGILTRILGAINQDEYNNLVDYLERMRTAQDTYENSAAGVIKMFIQDLPKNATEAADLLKDVDLSKYEQVNRFTKAANGGRPIPMPVEN